MFICDVTVLCFFSAHVLSYFAAPSSAHYLADLSATTCPRTGSPQTDQSGAAVGPTWKLQKARLKLRDNVWSALAVTKLRLHVCAGLCPMRLLLCRKYSRKTSLPILNTFKGKRRYGHANAGATGMLAGGEGGLTRERRGSRHVSAG